MAGFLWDEKNLPAIKKAARIWRLFGSLAAILRLSAILPPPASCRR
jgi:hypothetical protein